MIFVNQSLGYLSSDTIFHFINNNEEVLVIAGSDIDFPLVSDKLKIIKCCKYNTKNSFTRILSWTCFFIQTIFYIKKNSKQHNNIFFVSNPPLLFFIPLFFKKHDYFLLIYDLYPDVFKIKLNSSTYKLFSFWENINKKVFDRATLIFTIGQNMRLAVSKYVNYNKIFVIYNWANEKLVPCMQHDVNLFFPELKDKFIFTYSGNMGSTHDFSAVCKFVDLFQAYNSSFCFVFVGGGEKLLFIKNFVKDKQISNVFFYSKLPFVTFKILLRISNMGVVTLDKTMERFSFPSKTATYLNEGLPLLNFSSYNSEVFAIVENHKVGVNIDSTNLDKSCREVVQIISDTNLYERLRNNSLSFSTNFLSSNNSRKYFELIEESRHA
jgi:hypothetical protein